MFGNSWLGKSEDNGTQTHNKEDGENSNSGFQEKRRSEYETRWSLIKLAAQHNFSGKEFDIGLLYSPERPIQWLLKHWDTNIKYVKLSVEAELRKLGCVYLVETGAITELDARIALRKHKGNHFDAAKDYLEETLRKYAVLLSSGPLSSEANHNIADVGATGNDRIISHLHLSSGNPFNGTSTEHILGHQQLANRNAAMLPGTPIPSIINPSTMLQSVQTHLTRVNTALDHTQTTIMQSAGMTNMHDRTQNYLQGQVRNSRATDGVYPATPALSAHEKEE